MQDDLLLVSRPFAQLAKNLGLSETQVLARLQFMRDEKLLRRWGVTLHQQKAGFFSNLMVAWQVPEERTEEVGMHLANCRQITHCYLRQCSPEFPYNIFCMIHCYTEEQCLQLVQELAKTTGVQDYILLFSREELKKTSMQYFSQEPANEEVNKGQ